MEAIAELTIVIPYYKRHFFYSTLLSLQEQTNQNFNVFIGDDCSPHDPTSIINSFEKTLTIFYRKFGNNLGAKSLPAQWHRCIHEAPKSNWIMILGDDDMLSKNCVRDFYENLREVQNKKIKVIRFASQIIDADNKEISKVHKHVQEENSVDFLFKKINGLARSSLSEHIFCRKSCEIRTFKNFPLGWHSDDLALIEFSDFKQIFSINSSTVFIRSSEFNISSSVHLAKIKNVSSYHFYKYLLQNYQMMFSSNRTEILFRKLEKCLFNNRKNFSLFKDITYYYLKNRYILRYSGFLLKFFDIKGKSTNR